MQTLSDGDSASSFRIKINYNFSLVDNPTIVRTLTAPTFQNGTIVTAPVEATILDEASALTARNDGGTGDDHVAAIAFECTGSFKTKMYMRHDGYLGIGGGDAGTWRWYVDTATGNMTAAGNVTAYSDGRLKEEVAPITGALAKVKSLLGVTYHRNDMDDKRRHMGFIAQDVQEVVPEVIVPSGALLTMAYGNLTALLVEAIKELEQRVTVMEAKT